MCALNDHRCVCAELTESKHELQNPIRDWWLSPNLRVAIQEGKFAGKFGALAFHAARL